MKSTPKKTTLWVGMDVHKERIAVSVLPEGAREPRPVVMIANTPGEIRKLFTRLRKEGEIRACYEAGSCGYEVYRLLVALDGGAGDIHCEVIAPSLIPVKAGDRVKTDRRDAEKLARLYRAGELTSIRVPTEAQEALRDLVRCREDLREAATAERHQLLKFLLRHGRVFTGTKKHWSLAHWAWLRQQRFDDATLQVVFGQYLARLESTIGRLETVDKEIGRVAETAPYKAAVGRLRCLRGIDTLSAVGLIAEIYDFKRFGRASEFMAFVGLVPSERSSGSKQRRGSITKTGNSHARRLLVEAAWHYRRPARLRSLTMRRRWESQAPGIVAHAQLAQERLHRRFTRLTSRGKASQVAVTAVARELCGFVWAIGRADA
jgi:transposase